LGEAISPCGSRLTLAWGRGGGGGSSLAEVAINGLYLLLIGSLVQDDLKLLEWLITFEPRREKQEKLA
jgi:hypothetical protein